MVHERFDLKHWMSAYPLSGLDKSTDMGNTMTGPLPIAYVEQMRRKLRTKRRKLGEGTPVDLCVWNHGDSTRREVTKIGGLPYWPADEPWPKVSLRKPYTFVGQLCFADSRDIVPKLPGDILAILAADRNDWHTVRLHWFKLDGKKLLPPEELPPPQWPIQPCHAALHRTVEYDDAPVEMFEEYPFPLNMWACRFDPATKIGGVWHLRGELENPKEIEDEWYREVIEAAWKNTKTQEKTFLCQLAIVEATVRQPFLNVAKRSDLAEYARKSNLMIGDVGGVDIFHKGKKTYAEWWCG